MSLFDLLTLVDASSKNSRLLGLAGGVEPFVDILLCEARIFSAESPEAAAAGSSSSSPSPSFASSESAVDDIVISILACLMYKGEEFIRDVHKIRQLFTWTIISVKKVRFGSVRIDRIKSRQRIVMCFALLSLWLVFPFSRVSGLRLPQVAASSRER